MMSQTDVMFCYQATVAEEEFWRVHAACNDNVVVCFGGQLLNVIIQ